ncbi:MAG TPA: pentapeptide repeat-containing protein [Bacteriovoracaceae bacterium]|nr:pentapeptide repeat-containing protein [Bacteriovoracaceae bacterium]
MITQVTEIIKDLPSERNQLIKDEHLEMVVVTSQVLTSCKILLSSYNQVVFSDCNFYACDFNGIEFNNCVFENCTFEFTHFRKCNFKNCNFSNCIWKGVSSISSVYEACDMDYVMNELCRNGRNTMSSGRKEHSTDIYIELALAC